MSDQAGTPTDGDDDGDAYLSVRLTGERFSSRGLPLDAINQLGNLRALLFQLARTEWLDANPERKRVPDGFDQMFDVRLVGIKDGSVCPQLMLRRRIPATDDDQEIFPAFERAPIRLVAALTSVADDRRLPDTFPAEFSGLLASIAKDLGDGEAMEIGPTKSAAAAMPNVTIDSSVRDTLKQIDESLKRRTPGPKTAMVEGVIVEFDGRRQSFQLRTDARFLTDCKLASGEFELAGTIKELLAEDGITAPDVRVLGQAVTDGVSRPREVTDVYDVQVVRTVHEKNLMVKLDSIESLQAGWFGRHSVGPDAGVLEAIRGTVPLLARLSLHLDLEARDNGCVAFETVVGVLNVTAIIEDHGHQMYLLADDDADGIEEHQLDFDSQKLAYFLEHGSLR